MRMHTWQADANTQYISDTNQVGTKAAAHRDTINAVSGARCKLLPQLLPCVCNDTSCHVSQGMSATSTLCITGVASSINLNGIAIADALGIPNSYQGSGNIWLALLPFVRYGPRKSHPSSSRHQSSPTISSCAMLALLLLS